VKKTRVNNSEVIKKAGTIVWNGPQGVFEMSNFAAGSMAILKDVTEATARGVLTIAGGGDTVALV